MPITISGDTPNFSAATITTLTAPTSTITTLNAPSGVLATQNGMTGIAKAWVNFSGSTGAVNGSFNVSSVTRSATGVFVVNLTTAVPNANYARIASATVNAAQNSGMIMILDWNGAAVVGATTSAYYISFYNVNGLALADPILGYSAIFSA
jgi:hypothetical protein